MKKNRRKIMAMALLASFFPVNVLAESMTVDFSENMTRNRSQTVTFPANAFVKDVTVNTGNVSYVRNGNQLTLNVSNGTPTKDIYNPTKYSKNISKTINRSYDSFPNTESYSDADGFSGTYFKSGASYQSSGTFTPEDRKTVTDYRTTYPGGSASSLPANLSYNSGGYTGTLYGGGAYKSSGDYTPEERRTETTTRSTSPGGSASSLPGSVSYSSGGFSGTLYAVSTSESGDWREESRRDFTSNRTFSCGNSWVWSDKSRTWSHGGTYANESIPSSISYSSVGYTGTLYRGGVTRDCSAPPPSGSGTYNGERRNSNAGSTDINYNGEIVRPGYDNRVWTRTYSGTVIKPASADTRVWRIDYSGTVIKPESDTRVWSQAYTGTAYAGGNDTYYKYTAIVNYGIDTEKPDGVLTASPTTWTNGDVSIVMSDIRDYGEAGINGVFLPNGTFTNGTSIPYTVTSNGNYSFIIEDNAGNRTTKSISVNNIDKSSPTATLSQTPTNLTNQNVTLNLSNIADGGVSGLKDVVMPDGKVETSFENKQFVVSENGTYVFLIRDNAGNVTTRSITVNNIDKIAPTAILTQTPTAFTNQNVTLNLTSVQDTGVAGLKSVTLPNGTKVSPGSTSYVVSSNGTYDFVIEDNAGNTTTKSIDVKNIDKIMPTANLTSSNEEFTNQNIELYLTDIQDNGVSGLESIKLPNGQLVTAFNDLNYPVSTNGVYRFEIRDKAGNMTIRELTVSNIDKEKPTFSTDYSPKALNKGPVQISLTNVRDNGVSGLKELESTMSGILPGQDSYQMLVSENGTYTFTVRDHAGNEETKSVMIGNIDNQLPTATIEWAKEWTKDAVVLELKDFKDEGPAGYHSTKLPNGVVITSSVAYFTVQENGTYIFEIYDNVGNVNSMRVVVENIDKEKPNIQIDEKDKTKDDVKAVIKIRDTNKQK